MASNTIVEVTDDLDGSPDATTVSFAVRGRPYEIDLSPANQEAFDEALARYIDAARKPAGSPAPSRAASRARSASNGADTEKVRAWARENGWPALGTRGRIPRDVMAAYTAASPSAS